MKDVAATGSAPRPRIALLHGTNYWNMGDLGLVTAAVQRLQEATDGAIDIVSLSRFQRAPRPPGQAFTIESLGVREMPFLALPYPRIRPRLAHLAVITLRALGLGVAVWLTAMGFGAVVPRGLRRRVAPLLDAHVIVSKPGGFLHHHMAIDHLLQIWIATLSGRPVVIYGQSIGPFSSRWQRLAVGYVLRRCRLLLLRDDASMAVCRDELGLDRNRLRRTADEAFLLRSASPDEGTRILRNAGVPLDRPVVGMTAIQWSFPGAADREQAQAQYLDAMVGLVDHVHARYGTDVALFTFTYGRAYGRDDEAITAEITHRARVPTRVHRIAHTDPQGLKAALAQLDVFVGSRMHSNIFSLGAGTPALAIAYLPKTVSIMRMLALERYVVPIDGIDGPTLTQAFDRLWSDRQDVRTHLARTLPTIRERARQNARETLALAGLEA